MSLRLAPAVLFLVLFGAPGRGAEEWEPSRTHAVIVGVLKWEDPKVSGFSPRNRKDQELADTLIRRGVPRKQIKLLLDEQATLAHIRNAIRAIAKQAAAGDFFLFYYAGHGGGTEKGGVSLLNYDAGAGKPAKPA